MFIHFRTMIMPQDTKDKLEQAALVLFVRQGIDGTSVRDIATAAGVSQGALYNHYPSKEELAFELFSRGWSEMGAELRRLSQSKKSIDDKFHTMVDYVFSQFDKNWSFVAYTFFSRHAHLRHVSSTNPNPYLVFRAIIREAMQDGEIPRMDLDVATSMVMGAIIQVIDTQILGHIKRPLATKARTVARACAALLKG